MLFYLRTESVGKIMDIVQPNPMKNVQAFL